MSLCNLELTVQQCVKHLPTKTSHSEHMQMQQQMITLFDYLNITKFQFRF